MKNKVFVMLFLSIKRTQNEMIPDKKSRGFVKNIIVCIDMIDESIKQYNEYFAFCYKEKENR
jgi:hypothetical protein